jgi:hypothetical protein
MGDERPDDQYLPQTAYSEDQEYEIAMELQEAETQRQKKYTKADEDMIQQEIEFIAGEEDPGDGQQ